MLDALKALKQARRWCVYRLETKPGMTKPAKIPYNALTGARENNPQAGCTYDEALNAVKLYSFDGLAFFTGDATDLGFPGFRFFLYDFDGVRNASSGEITDPDAAPVVMHMTQAGAAWEVSQSREGFHIFGLCRAADVDGHRTRDVNRFEFYSQGRFIALGRAGLEGWQGNPFLDWTDYVLSRLPAAGAKGGAAGFYPEWGDGPHPEWRGPADDETLIKTALAARGTVAQVFGTKASFTTLWNASPNTLAEFFPLTGGTVRPNGLKYDASSADLALMNGLGYWTGCDAERMVRLFSMSGLGKRDKWKTRGDYRAFTVRKTISGFSARNAQVYNSDAVERRKIQQARAEAIEDEKEEKVGELRPVLTADEMLPRLRLVMQGTKDGVGVVDMALNCAWTTTQATAFYRASITEVVDDKIDEKTGLPKVKFAKSLDVWHQSASLRWVHTVTWKPCKHGKKRAIVDPPEGRGMAYNMWDDFAVPADASHMMQDAALREAWLLPWHEHLKYLIPHDAERERFEQWLAHILQDPGVLPQTAWLMWTEATGIGRNWLAQVLSQVLRGYVAAGVGIDVAVDSKGFNGRLSRKLLATVDEAKAGMADGSRYQRAETLKSKINEQFREIDNKYGMKFIEYNCMRWLFFSNHADALPFDRSDRRINVVENPSVRRSAEYYAWLYGFVYSEQFISAVWAHLMTLDLSGFNPGEHAMSNAAKRTALSDMESPLVKALRDYAATLGPDKVVTVRQLRDWLTLQGEVDAKSMGPRALGYAIKNAGFISFPERLDLRVGDKRIRENIIIINAHNLKLEQFIDVSTGQFLPGATHNLQNYLKL